MATSNNKDSIEKIVTKDLVNSIDCKNITITRGKKGSFSYINKKIENVPALISNKVIDTIGAGDVFLVIASLLYSVKTSQLITNIIGNIAAALKVDILGHSKSICRSNFFAIINHILK